MIQWVVFMSYDLYTAGKNQWRFAFKELKGEEFQLDSKQI